MTTKHSPLSKLKAQADKIAQKLKAMERGENVHADPLGKIEAARGRDALKFVVAMDDKFISIEMPWAKIRETSEVGISEWILRQMRESREAGH